LKKGGRLAALLLFAAALWGPEGAAADIPWGAGCIPAAEGVQRTADNCGADLVDGEAIPPPTAPPAVKQVIQAADEIRHRPYVWGGGHRSWLSRGYDCSGAVSYALHRAGLLGETMVSGQLARWGEAGAGRWISVYANRDHVFMVVAGLRFDTRGNPAGVSGPRWHRGRVDPAGFAVRHPAGL
jgi:NlpC/P60 family